jgi:hypothetical protein
MVPSPRRSDAAGDRLEESKRPQDSRVAAGQLFGQRGGGCPYSSSTVLGVNVAHCSRGAVVRRRCAFGSLVGEDLGGSCRRNPARASAAG